MGKKQIQKIIDQLPITLYALDKYEILYQEKMRNEIQQIRNIDNLDIAREMKEKKEEELRQIGIMLIKIEDRIVDLVGNLIKENNITRNNKVDFIERLGKNVYMPQRNPGKYR